MDMVKADNMIDVYLKSGKMNIVSRITRSASEDLEIVIGDYVYAVFKASIPYLIREEYNERVLYWPGVSMERILKYLNSLKDPSNKFL